MEHQYVLVVVSYGDGESNYGKRVTTLRFRTLKAADEASAWLNQDDNITTRIYED